MTDDIQINVWKRGKSTCVAPDYHMEVQGSAQYLDVLERIADALETKQTATLSQEQICKYAQENAELAEKVGAIFNYCRECKTEDKKAKIRIKENCLEVTNNTEEILNYCPVCGNELETTVVSIGFKCPVGIGEQALEAHTIKYCSCGFVKTIGMK